MAVDSIVGQALLLISAVIVGFTISRFSRLQPALSCLLVGLGLNLLMPYWGLDSGMHSDNLQTLIFYLLLPVLIFESCWRIQTAQLKHWFKTILCLAVLGVLTSCVLFVPLWFTVINESDGPSWLAALMVAIILSATDPRAIIKQLKTRNSPRELRFLLEGESLLNNAICLALFSLLLALSSASINDSASVGYFFSNFFGSLFVGAVLGLVAAIVVLLLGQQASTRIVLLFTAFLSYYLSAHILHASGVMSVLGAAITTRYCLRDHQHFVDGIESTWQWLGLLARNVLFVLAGLVITQLMFVEHWPAMLIAVISALIARAATVYSGARISKNWPQPLTKQWCSTMVFGGLRGAIAIALVLALPSNLPYWSTVQAMVFAVVLFNIIIHAVSLSWLPPAVPLTDSQPDSH